MIPLADCGMRNNQMLQVVSAQLKGEVLAVGYGYVATVWNIVIKLRNSSFYTEIYSIA